MLDMKVKAFEKEKEGRPRQNGKGARIRKKVVGELEIQKEEWEEEEGGKLKVTEKAMRRIQELESEERKVKIENSNYCKTYKKIIEQDTPEYLKRRMNIRTSKIEECQHVETKAKRRIIGKKKRIYYVECVKKKMKPQNTYSESAQQLKAEILT